MTRLGLTVNEAKTSLKNARQERFDFLGYRHKLKVVGVLALRRHYWKGDSETFAPCYLNAYTANGAVIGTCFGDAERGEAARKALAKSFPRRHLIMLKMDHIAEGGGGVHCLT